MPKHPNKHIREAIRYVTKEYVMKTHEFTLVLSAGPSEADADKLYGICSDGTLATIAGVPHIDFHREAACLEDALRSALEDVRAAGFTVQRVEMEPDAVLLPT